MAAAQRFGIGAVGHCRANMALTKVADQFSTSTSIESSVANLVRSGKIGTDHDLEKVEKNQLDDTNLEKVEDGDIIYYLAYGSNLSAETFLGMRGIRPLSQINVCVPDLKLTFDLAGIPYAEPCFANTNRRDPEADAATSAKADAEAEAAFDISTSDLILEKQPLYTSTYDDEVHYHKDRWLKPLVGVLYGLTPSDFAHVIATEGGGAGYTDIKVACYPLDAGASTVPMTPTSTPIEGRTLFAPPLPPADPGKNPGPGRRARPDPSYAQPSARYLKLITDGAREHHLPAEYRQYLAGIRPYTVTTRPQSLGKFLFVSIWIPLVMAMRAINKATADKNGRVPKWVASLQYAIFMAVWTCYDDLFKDLFGDGERTIGQ